MNTELESIVIDTESVLAFADAKSGVPYSGITDTDRLDWLIGNRADLECWSSSFVVRWFPEPGEVLKSEAATARDAIDAAMKVVAS